MARKRSKKSEARFEEADAAVAELADGAFDAAFDAVTMDDGEEVDLAAQAEKEAAEKRAAEAAKAEALRQEAPTKGPTQAELMTGVGLETPPEDTNEGEAEESTLGLPPAAEEREPEPEFKTALAGAQRSAHADNDVAAVGSTSGARPPDADGELAVQGRLEQLRLVEIVQMMEFGKKSGWVEVEPEDGGFGELGFVTGMCTWAKYGEAESDEGFCTLCETTVGKFRIFYGYEPQLTNIESPTQFLLLDALRRIDEGAHDDDDDEASLEAAFLMDNEPGDG